MGMRMTGSRPIRGRWTTSLTVLLIVASLGIGTLQRSYAGELPYRTREFKPDSAAQAAKEAIRIERARIKEQQRAERRNMRQDLTRDQQQQLKERIQQLEGMPIGQHITVSGGVRGTTEEWRTDSISKRAIFIRSLQLSDSVLQARNIAIKGFPTDSTVLLLDRMEQLQTIPDTIVTRAFSDSLLLVVVPDSVLRLAPFPIYRDSVNVAFLDSGKVLEPLADTAQVKKHRFRITQDTLRAGRVTLFSALAPGFGQIYNRQAWKLPIVYGGIGGFLTGGFIYSSKHKDYKAEYQRTLDLRLPPEVQRVARNKMRRANSTKTLMFGMAGATYLYSIADAVFKYRGPVDPVRKATTLAAIFPGMGFVYTKTYWRLPIYYGGYIALATVIDYNNRSYQRYKTAYDLATDGNPATVDEFGGRYSPELLAKVRKDYRRDRDLAIIGMAAAYVLSIVDTYVIANLKNWDVDEDLSANTLRIEPSVQDNRMQVGNERRLASPSAPATTYGLALRWRF